jgi:hypothetical protein
VTEGKWTTGRHSKEEWELLTKVLRELGAWPYVMKYNDRQDDPWLNDFDRWVNARMHKVCSFQNYKPRRNH